MFKGSRLEKKVTDGNTTADRAVDEEFPTTSFVLGEILYTISTLEDTPAFKLPNHMDGTKGHVGEFTYPGSGAEAEDTNKQLW